MQGPVIHWRRTIWGHIISLEQMREDVKCTSQWLWSSKNRATSASQDGSNVGGTYLMRANLKGSLRSDVACCGTQPQRLHAQGLKSFVCETIAQRSPHHHHRGTTTAPGHCVALQHDLDGVYNGVIAPFNSPSSKHPIFKAFSALHYCAYSDSHNISFELLSQSQCITQQSHLLPS